MTSKLSVIVQEGSTFGIKVDFIEKTLDGEEGAPIIPNPGLTWSLTDVDGSPINNRVDVPLDRAESVVVVLSGDDLALNAGYPVRRYLTIQGTYNSFLGINLALKDELSFQIENLVGVS